MTDSQHFCGVPDAINRQPVVVINGCDHDASMEIKKQEWIAELDGCKRHDALLSLDRRMNRTIAGQLRAAVARNFHTIQIMEYTPPLHGPWPIAANFAFQESAWYMFDDGRAWFWMESDCVPLKPRWLEALSDEYWKCGKPLMGSIVSGRGHLNGTAIYPANFPVLSPKAMTASHVAWDWEMTGEIIHLAHNSRQMCHCWGIVNGQPSPYEGPAASFSAQEQVDRWVPPEAATFHRSKDGTLIARLRERRKGRVAIPAGGGGGAILHV